MTSVSTSTSFIPQYSEEPFLQQIAQYAQSMAGNMYSWAQDAYGKTSQLTDQVVSNFLHSSEMSRGLAQNALDRYQNTFQPQENALIKDANTYASPEKIRSEMGMAQAGVEQAGEHGRQNALADLQSYGIDPSSGRYASLDRAERAMTAAAAAGAGNQARRATEQTGRALRSEAIQVGERYPGIAMSAINSGMQALTGAQNASLSNANTGKNLMGLPNDYLRTASELKYPPLGNRSSGSNMEGGGGSSGGGGSGGSHGGGGDTSVSSRNGTGGDQSWAMNHPQPVSKSVDDGEGGGGRGKRGKGGGDGDGEGGNGKGKGKNGKGRKARNGHDDYDDFYDFLNPGAAITNVTPGKEGPQYGPNEEYGPFGFDPDNPFQNPTDQWPDFSQTDPDQEASDQFSQADLYGFDAQDGWNGDSNGGWNGTYDQGANDDSGFDYGQGNNDQYETASLGQSWGNDNSSQADLSGGGGGGDTYNFWGDDDDEENKWGNYAAGGTATPGGRVPEGMSDSGGLQTDDVPANLTAGEFVIPRDVALWKGQEFFQKLIDGSRAKSGSATAKGQPSNSPPQKPRFNSRPQQGGLSA